MMFKYLLAFTLLATSSASWAYKAEQNQRALSAGVTTEKSQAYELGLAKLDGIISQSPKQLRNTLSLYESGIKAQTINIDNAYVTVKEFSTPSGDINYQSYINLDYSYRRFEPSN